jgi:hypothetical protein
LFVSWGFIIEGRDELVFCHRIPVLDLSRGGRKCWIGYGKKSNA